MLAWMMSVFRGVYCWKFRGRKCFSDESPEKHQPTKTCVDLKKYIKNVISREGRLDDDDGCLHLVCSFFSSRMLQRRVTRCLFFLHKRWLPFCTVASALTILISCNSFRRQMGTPFAGKARFSLMFVFLLYLSPQKSRFGEWSITFYHFCHHVVFPTVSADRQLLSQPLKGRESIYRSFIPHDFLPFTSWKWKFKTRSFLIYFNHIWISLLW